MLLSGTRGEVYQHFKHSHAPLEPGQFQKITTKGNGKKQQGQKGGKGRAGSLSER